MNISLEKTSFSSLYSMKNLLLVFFQVMLCKRRHREKSSTSHSISPAFQPSVSSPDDNQHLSCQGKLTLAVLKAMTESKCSR